MSISGSKRLYELLPLIYRALDDTRGRPLQALLGIIGEEYDRLHADMGQLYKDWFIETCEEDLVPYIGELVGVPVQEPTGAPPYLLRARVGNALRHRRRKGVPDTLEQVIWETCGWSAAVLESFRNLAATQHVDSVHLERGRAVDVRRGAPTLLAQAGPRTGYLADVRGDDHTTTPEGLRGLFNTFHVGLLLSRMLASAVERSEPHRVAEGRYTFHALGLDTPLFTLLRREERPELPPSLEMPLPLSPQALEEEVAAARAALSDPHAPARKSRLMGPEHGLEVLWDETPVPLEDLEPRSLEHWHRPGPALVGLRSGRALLELPQRHVHLEAWMGEEGPHLLRLHRHATESLPTLAAALEEALRTASPRPAFAHARVLLSGHHLLVLPGLPLEGAHPVRFGATPEDPESAHELGLTPEHARRAAVLVSHELPAATGEPGQGHFRVRLGEGTPLSLSVPLGASPEAMAHALRHQLEPHEGWHALAHGDLLLVFAETRGGTEYLRAEEDAGDTRTVRRLGLSPRVAVDVKRGRLALSLGEPPGQKLRVSWAYGRATDIGAGPYPRDVAVPDEAPTWRAEVCEDALPAWSQESPQEHFPSLAKALSAWEDQPKGTRGLIRVLDSSTYAPAEGERAFHVRLHESSTLRVEAAEGELPTLDGELVAHGPTGLAWLELDGLQLRGLEVRGSLRLTVAHATVLGPLHAPHEAAHDASFRDVVVRDSLLGQVRLPAVTSRLEVSGGILHPGQDGTALRGVDGSSPGPAARLTGTTVLGAVYAEALPLAQDCLFTRRVEVRHVQESLLRSCALPWDSRHLPRHHCVLFHAPPEAAEGAAIDAGPEFVSLSPGEPGYARLADDGPRELRTGAQDGGEFGVYHPLQEERRLVALRGVLEEYLPAGLSAGVFFID